MDMGKVVKYTNNSDGFLEVFLTEVILFSVQYLSLHRLFHWNRRLLITAEKYYDSITGRHDPIIVPRAIVVVEAMTAITLVDLLLTNMASRIENIIKFYK